MSRSSEPEPKARRRRPPATTPQARENQMISLAADLAQKQLEEGNASAQVITHYLKLGSVRESLEREKLSRENDLLRSKVDQIASSAATEELYKDALNAMRAYGGQEVEDYED